MAVRTPALAVVAKDGAWHRTHEYAHDPRSQSYGLEAAEQLAIDPAQVFKTLVVTVDGTLTVVLVPVALEVGVVIRPS